ncbi:hypothetical protein MMC13_004121 [Lambiella insularis]|nr:hypothetical protein [Lambiella insularis]
MPGIVQKLMVVPALDGLLLQPSTLRNQRASPTIQISYKTNAITTLRETHRGNNKNAVSLEAHGIVGLLTVASFSYLISISSRHQVAQIRGKPIYVITDVALIPLSSQAAATKAINQCLASSKRAASRASGAIASDSDSSEDERAEASATEDNDPTVPHTPEAETCGAAKGEENDSKSTSVVEDVIGKKGQYGRFAERWFSRKGWSVEKRRMQGMSAGDIKEQVDDPPQPYDTIDKSESQTDTASSTVVPDQARSSGNSAPDQSNVAESFIPKLLKTTRLLLGSQSFFFAYEYDITRRLGTSQVKSTEMPLYKAVDPLFFWNRHLTSPFIDAGQHPFVLPLLQGFVGQRAFTVNTESDDPSRTVAAAKEDAGEVIELQNNASHDSAFQPSAKTRDFLITLISRRSTLRPGLRYLRRGVDSEGNTANYVETEQILSDPSWSPSTSIYSFTQIRGSIPLFFSQSPYSFKPVPVLQHSEETNRAAFRSHFTKLVDRYGRIQIVSLVDKSGGEAKIGEEYEKHTNKLNDENGVNGTKPEFEWFDFHNVCRGMKFENVSILMDSIGPILNEYGSTVENDGKIQRTQSGILRTNCIDCIDRTSVSQSTCSQKSLETQLKGEGITLDLQTDVSTQWFNTLWADNGDAISKQYSSTAALKGDYTRTRKRNYRGAINDFGLTLSRYFNNIVNDYFSQAAIDFLLGNVTDQVFAEFEANMMSGDPAMSMRKVRQSAIDTSSKIVIADQSEKLLGGWTLLCPREPNTLRTFPFEEVVLLLTDAAIYGVRFDWNMEKVAGFERVDLRSVVGIMKGVYITSTLVAAQIDEQKNVGFVIRYRPGQTDVTRINTRSLTSAVTSNGKDFDEARKNREGGGRALTEREGAEENDAKNDEAAVDSKKGMTEKHELEGSPSSPPIPKSKPDPMEKDKPTELKIFAFKALPANSSLASGVGQDSERQQVTEMELVKTVCHEIAKAIGGDALGGKRVVTSEGLIRMTGGIVEEGDIISLAEARKSTGLLEQLGHSLKKLVWA